MEFMNKMTTRAACVERYGPIDFISRTWPNQSKWMAMLEVPREWFPTWTVLDSKIPVKHIYCNIDMHKPLISALQSVYALKLGGELHTFDGCFNIRQVRGSNMFSAHSYGLALDIYAKRNLMGYVLRTSFSPAFVKCFTEQGLAWGGNFRGRKDPMHFSYCFEG